MEHKKITYEGKVYTTDMKYEFSDDGMYWYEDTLHSIRDPMYLSPFMTNQTGATNYCRESQAEQYVLGTIEDAPVEVVEGQAYMFNYYFGGDLVKDVCGLCYYSDDTNWFTIVDGIFTRNIIAKYATNIRPLTYNGDK